MSPPVVHRGDAGEKRPRRAYLYFGGGNPMTLKKMTSALAIVTLSFAALATTGCAARAKVTVAAATPEPEPTPAPAPPPKEEPPPAMQGDEIVMPEQIEFDSSKATIRNTDRSLRVLNELAGILKKHPSITKLRIEGHTDSSGRPEKNTRLSKARADAVAKWLVEHEVDRARLATVGLGDSKPLADNTTPEGRQSNRRTEFHVEELDGKPVGASGNGGKAGN
jgi:OOP family OmpA-OmpF porin